MCDRLDCTGEPCPLPLIKAEKRLNKLKVGEKICIEVDHTCSMTNIPEWARKKNYKITTKEVDFGEWEITITKTR